MDLPAACARRAGAPSSTSAQAARSADEQVGGQRAGGGVGRVAASGRGAERRAEQLTHRVGQRDGVGGVAPAGERTHGLHCDT